jgi:hypothetical protein
MQRQRGDGDGDGDAAAVGDGAGRQVADVAPGRHDEEGQERQAHDDRQAKAPSHARR